MVFIAFLNLDSRQSCAITFWWLYITSPSKGQVKSVVVTKWDGDVYSVASLWVQTKWQPQSTI